MKVYNLNIDTSKPTNQTVQMQQNATGMLSVAISNDGTYIRNLSCQMYDGDNEIEATTSADTSFGFKVDVSSEPKHVKVVAKSTPLESIREYVLSSTPGSRVKQYWLNQLVVPEGVYNQDEFAPILDLCNYPPKPYPGTPKSLVLHGSSDGKANFKTIRLAPWNPSKQIWFEDADSKIIPSDEPIVVSSEISAGISIGMKAGTVTLSSETYPAVGYYTDYQMDTLVNPSVNAPYDGNYAEPLKEVEVDGVKFVPTTLSVDGVEYKVLAEAQPTPEPEPEEPTTTEGE